MNAIITVVSKVAVMLILIILGAVVTKIGMLTERGASEITSLLVKIVTPCLIINSLINSGELKISEILAAAVLPAASMGIGIAVSLLLFKKEPPERRKVLRFSVIFCNAGFMGLPLVQGIIGDRGVALGSFFVVVFNLICWTYGYSMMSGGRLNVKTALLNPGIIGLVIGLPIYFLKIPLPDIISEPIGFLSGLNTPLAMLVIGSYVARLDPKAFVSDASIYKMCFFRLALCPALYLGLLLILKPEHDIFISSVIQASAPVAANTMLFAVEYKQDSQLASKAVAVSTVLSIITIPGFTIIAQLACGS